LTPCLDELVSLGTGPFIIVLQPTARNPFYVATQYTYKYASICLPYLSNGSISKKYVFYFSKKVLIEARYGGSTMPILPALRRWKLGKSWFK
jgi:hypothetical protein